LLIADLLIAADDPAEILLHKELCCEMRRLLATLSQSESSVLVCRYGLDGNGARTLYETAEEVFPRLSREGARQVEIRALKKLAKWDRAKRLYEFLEESIDRILERRSGRELRGQTREAQRLQELEEQNKKQRENKAERWRLLDRASRQKLFARRMEAAAEKEKSYTMQKRAEMRAIREFKKRRACGSLREILARQREERTSARHEHRLIRTGLKKAFMHYGCQHAKDWITVSKDNTTHTYGCRLCGCEVTRNGTKFVDPKYESV
jgi:hypothetical protein